MSPNLLWTTSRLSLSCLRCSDTTRSSHLCLSARTSSGISHFNCLPDKTEDIVIYVSKLTCVVLFRPTLTSVAHCGPAGGSSRGWCRFPNQVASAAAAAAATRTAQHFFVRVGRTVSVSASGVTLAWCCRLWATEGDASPDREKSLELIRYLMPEALNGALVDSLSGHALSAAGLAASFLLEGTERSRLTAPPASICSVIRAHKPGWCFVVRSVRILIAGNAFFILSILLIWYKKSEISSFVKSFFRFQLFVLNKSLQTSSRTFHCSDMKIRNFPRQSSVGLRCCVSVCHGDFLPAVTLPL